MAKPIRNSPVDTAAKWSGEENSGTGGKIVRKKKARVITKLPLKRLGIALKERTGAETTIPASLMLIRDNPVRGMVNEYVILISWWPGEI